MKRSFIFALCTLSITLSLQQRSAVAGGSADAQPMGRPLAVAPQALIAPSQGPSQPTVVVTAAGFAPFEAVTFRLGQINPFSGSFATLVFTVSGVADRAGRLGDHWGSISVPSQVLPTSLPGGLYTLQATGAASGRIASTTVSLPFLFYAQGLRCPTQPLTPNRYGVAFGAWVPGTSLPSFAPGTEVLATTDFPQAVDAAARVNRLGRFLLLFRVPAATPPARYDLVVAGLSAGIGSQEQLRSCSLTVAGDR